MPWEGQGYWDYRHLSQRDRSPTPPGISPREAMALMRHTDLRLTMKMYTNPRFLDLAGAVATLPILLTKPAEAQAAQATGADVRPTDPDANPPGRGSKGNGGRDAGRTQSVTVPSAENGDCSASIDEQASNGEVSVSPEAGGNRQEKSPSGGDGDKSGRWDSNPRRRPWEGRILPLNYARNVSWIVACRRKASMRAQPFGPGTQAFLRRRGGVSLGGAGTLLR